jgi:hypothetical protein
VAGACSRLVCSHLSNFLFPGLCAQQFSSTRYHRASSRPVRFAAVNERGAEVRSNYGRATRRLGRSATESCSGEHHLPPLTVSVRRGRGPPGPAGSGRRQWPASNSASTITPRGRMGRDQSLLDRTANASHGVAEGDQDIPSSDRTRKLIRRRWGEPILQELPHCSTTNSARPRRPQARKIRSP